MNSCQTVVEKSFINLEDTFAAIFCSTLKKAVEPASRQRNGSSALVGANRLSALYALMH